MELELHMDMDAPLKAHNCGVIRGLDQIIEVEWRDHWEDLDQAIVSIALVIA